MEPGREPSTADEPTPERPGIATPEPPVVPVRRAVFALLALALVVALLYVLVGRVIGIERLRNLVTAAGPWAPVAYVLLKSSTFVIAPLSGTLLKVSAGTLFGFWEGSAYTLLGDVLGGSINFWLARLLGRRAVLRLAGPDGMARVDRLGRQVGEWKALLFARLVLSAFYDFISYAAGLTGMPYRHYLAVTALAGIFPVLFFVSLGASIGEGKGWLLLLSGGLALLFILMLLLQRRIWRLLRSRR